MPAYDSHRFKPPAPLAYVTLRQTGTANGVNDVPMLLDYGADITLVPINYAAQLGALAKSGVGYELAAFDGKKSIAPATDLDLVFLNRVFSGQFVLIDQGWGIMGRNILNHLAVLLDGPNLSWREHA